MAAPVIAAKALSIARGLITNSAKFVKGVSSSSRSFVVESTSKSFSKIKENGKKIRYEKKKKKKMESQLKEYLKRKGREDLLESKSFKAGNSIIGKFKNIILKPIEALWKFFQLWIVDNLPYIIKKITIFTKKVRIALASIKSVFVETGSIITGVGRVIKAAIKNISNLDFTDESGEIAAARRELDESKETLLNSFDEIGNVWGRTEEELDFMLKELDEGRGIKEIVSDIESGIPYVERKTPSVGPGSGEQKRRPVSGGSAKGDSLFDLIASGEGDYNSVNRGNAGDTPGGANSIFGKNLTEMTVGQVVAAQQRDQVFAVGKYQIIPSTMQEFLKNSPDIKSTDKFDARTQEKFKDYVINVKRPSIGRYLRGESDDRDAAAQAVAREFASVGLTRPEAGRGRGQSRYAGTGNNAASISPEQVGAALDKDRSAGSNPQPKPQSDRPVDTPKNNQLSGLLKPKDFNTSSGKTIARTSNRGPRGGGYHGGIDFGTGGLKGYYAALTVGGKITFVGGLSGYGKTVIIDIGGVELLFAHLERYGAGIKQGASYNSGQPIGEIGNTGRSSGIHLHFEARPPGGSGGSDIDPEPYVKYLYFGKMSPKVAAKDVTVEGKSREIATQTASTLESRRTGGTRVKSKNTVMIKNTVMMT